MERITKLAQPKSHKSYKSLFLKDIKVVNPAALKYKASQRIEELSLPKKNFGPDEKNRNNTKSSSASFTSTSKSSKRTTFSSDSNRNVRKSKI